MWMLPPAVKIYLSAQPVDLRRSFDALAQTAHSVLGCDPFTGHLFVFRNKRGDRLKILFWDRSGFVIWYKRLEQGFFKWLPSEDATAPTRIEISAPDLAFILEGIDMSGAKRQRRYQRPSAS